jgi:hypothetical protein
MLVCDDRGWRPVVVISNILGGIGIDGVEER